MPAILISSDGGTNSGDYSMGWLFHVNQSITVDALGFYDQGGDGLISSHDVGIFDSGGTLLISTTVTTANTLISGFRYAAIPPLMLAAGQDYTVSSVLFFGGDLFAFNPSFAAVDPSVTFINNRFLPTSTLDFPTSGAPATLGFFGANFNISTAAAPEMDPRGAALPFCFVLFGLALILTSRRGLA